MSRDNRVHRDREIVHVGLSALEAGAVAAALRREGFRARLVQRTANAMATSKTIYVVVKLTPQGVDPDRRADGTQDLTAADRSDQ